MAGHGRVEIRSAVPADAAGITAIYASVVEHSVASFELVPPDEEEIARRLSAASPMPWLVADDARVLGYAYAGRFRQRPAYRWSVETSVYVDGAHAARGIGTALMTELLDRLTAAGYVMAFAGVALPNPPSERLHQSLGFRLIGVFPHAGYKQGGWRDVAWWSKQLRALPDVPEEPAST